MAGRSVARVAAVLAIGAIGAGGGAIAAVLTREQPVPIGAAGPVSPVPSAATSTPRPVVTADPAFPPAMTKPERWRSRELPRGVTGQTTIRAEVPEDWKDIIFTGANPVDGRFRMVRDYYLRVRSRPDMTSLAQARADREAELRRNATAELNVISTDSGSVESRIDGTTRRYEELFYSFVDITDHNYRRFVRIRWVDGIELAATGRARDIEGLAAVLDRATRTVELVPGTKTDKPG